MKSSNVFETYGWMNNALTHTMCQGTGISKVHLFQVVQKFSSLGITQSKVWAELKISLHFMTSVKKPHTDEKWTHVCMHSTYTCVRPNTISSQESDLWGVEPTVQHCTLFGSRNWWSCTYHWTQGRTFFEVFHEICSFSTARFCRLK